MSDITTIIASVDAWFDDWNALPEDDYQGRLNLIAALEFIVLDFGRELLQIGDFEAYNVTRSIRKRLRTTPDPFMVERLEAIDLTADLCTMLEAGAAAKPNGGQKDIVDSVLRDFLAIWETRKSYADAGKRMAEKLNDDDYEKYKQAKLGRRIEATKQAHFTSLAKNWKQTGIPENLK